LSNSRADYQLKERVEKERQRIKEERQSSKGVLPDLNTADVLNRIMIGLNHKHPSDVKKMFQEIDRKSKVVKEKATLQEIIHFCSQSPEVPRSRMALLQIEDFLRSQPIFQEKPDYIISQLAIYFVSETYHEGQVLFRQGEPGTKFYYTLTGRIRLSVNKPGTSHMDANAPQNFLTVINPREKLGDYALLNDTARSTSATAMDHNTTVLTLDKGAFLRLMSVAHQVDIRFNVKILKKFDLLANLDMQGLKNIAEKFYTRKYPPNTVILEENQLVESVFFLRSGKCAVFKNIWVPLSKYRIIT
jgi:CRP-like cAMP-binding protein